MLTLMSRDVRKLASAVVAVAIVSFGLLAVDQGHMRTVREAEFAAGETAPVAATPVVTLPEVVVVANRIEG